MPARGVNTARVSNSRWGSRGSGTGPNDPPLREIASASRPAESSKRDEPSSKSNDGKAAGVTSAAEARRAQLREESRKAQELVEKLKKEEEELERKLQEEKRDAARGADKDRNRDSVKTQQEITIELQRKREKEIDAINEARRSAREARFAGSYGLSTSSPRSPFTVSICTVAVFGLAYVEVPPDWDDGTFAQEPRLMK